MPETLHLTDTERVAVVTDDAERLVVDVTYAPGGSPPPAHRHPAQDERFEIAAGELHVRVDGEERVLRAGDVLEVPRGTVHAFWNAGDEEVRARWETAPAGRTLDWFRAISAAQERPAPLRAASLAAALTRYRDVFRLARG
ncbi:MAG TPA: cupin domain-containing protein [Baekduia sp.]|nr:cupin domain-containing protein [Baekduia sp.]